ncbi:MAG TPA: 2'-deoxycytidine 5'-triphosphate deaminase [Armatimonadota bacterium]|nr:2'-deoxycytidine 5'-triphosphate deaminase [Planctomycetota bacterium]HUV04074.1 2'-deoxycytidine 5'-triphosphate deaminase [Armatimonadota bacterium]
MSDPWKEWIPGVLCREQLRKLAREGHIDHLADPDGAIDQSSFDLSLSDEGYLLISRCVRPPRQMYMHALHEGKLVERLKPDKEGGYVLQADNTYIFKLRERLTYLDSAHIYGQATAKSSIGRLDVLARLIVDGMDYYDYFDPVGIQRGNSDLYLEITPFTFNIKVGEGVSLSQLRLFYGKPEMCTLSGAELYGSLVRDSKNDSDGSLSVDLVPAHIAGPHRASAFCARQSPNGPPPIDLRRKAARVAPCPFWRLLKSDDHETLRITRNLFYILRSKERLVMPKGVAVYCRAIDETIGEMRIHYAGFAHPFFGVGRRDNKEGTPLIFEVREHNIDVNLHDGAKIARLVFYRMSEDCSEPAANDCVPPPSGYNEQELTLSKFFEPWPEALEVDDDGIAISS